MRALVLGVLLALAIPGSAAAATQYYIPPGNSGANQYVESLPTAGGTKPTTGPSRSSSGASNSPGVLPRGTQSALVREGRDGAQTAAFVNATAPQGGSQSGGSSSRREGGTGGGGGAGGGGGGAGGATSPGGPGAGTGGASPAASVARSVTGLGGHGGIGLLAVALIVVVLGVGAVALRRRFAS